MRSKVIAPSLLNPGCYTVYGKGVDNERVRGAVDRLTADGRYPDFTIELVEDNTEGLLKPLSFGVTVRSENIGVTSSSDLTLYDSKKKQLYLLASAHGLLTQDQKNRCEADGNSRYVNEELKDSKYTLTHNEGTSAEMKLKSSPVVCFQEKINKKRERSWSENCLKDLGAIPISQGQLRQLIGSQTLCRNPVADTMIRVMSQKDLDEITAVKGVICEKRGEVKDLRPYHDGESTTGNHIAFKLDNPSDEYV